MTTRKNNDDAWNCTGVLDLQANPGEAKGKDTTHDELQA